MNIEQKLEAFKAEHPDAYKAIFDLGAKSNEQRPATIAELKAQFPGDAAFALQCAEQAYTATEAKAAYADVLTARLEKQGQEATAAADKVKGEHQAAMEKAAADHKTAIEQKDAEIADLKTKLDAMPRGNEAAKFDAETTDSAQAKKVKQLTTRMGSENLARFAAGINLPSGQAAAIPPAPKK